MTKYSSLIHAFFVKNMSGAYYLYYVLVAQSCPTLCNPMDWGSPGSSVHGILQGRILEQVAISFSRSSQPRDQTPALPADSLLSEPPGKLLSLLATYLHETLYQAFF